jgi:membrane associated rhomboid family serine protease
MFAFVPLGVEGGTIRLPIVGISIVLLCVAGFSATWLGVEDPWGNREDRTRSAVSYWKAKPYLELSDEFIDAKLGPSSRAGIAALREAFTSAGGALPPPAVLDAEQARLAELIEAALAPPVETPLRRYALVPARGVRQWGWVTHLFLHAGWMHLLGNMVFLYAAALLLEDAWGRLLFLLFYLSGGLAAALAEFVLNRGTAMVMVGASGAIAACIGAMMVRFTTRPMRMGYIVLLIVIPKMGTFTIPVWVWSAFFGLTQLFDLLTGGTPGVAVLAHVVGFGFGAGVALVMKVAGLDRTLVGTDEASLTSLRPSVLSEVEEAQAALQRGDAESARERYEAARQRSPHDVDPLHGLYWLELQAGRTTQAMQHLERLTQLLLRTSQHERARDTVLSAWSSFKPNDFRPVFALQVVNGLGEALPRDVRRRLWARGADEPGPPSTPPSWRLRCTTSMMPRACCATRPRWVEGEPLTTGSPACAHDFRAPSHQWPSSGRCCRW